MTKLNFPKTLTLHQMPSSRRRALLQLPVATYPAPLPVTLRHHSLKSQKSIRQPKNSSKWLRVSAPRLRVSALRLTVLLFLLQLLKPNSIPRPHPILSTLLLPLLPSHLLATMSLTLILCTLRQITLVPTFQDTHPTCTLTHASVPLTWTPTRLGKVMHGPQHPMGWGIVHLEWLPHRLTCTSTKHSQQHTNKWHPEEATLATLPDRHQVLLPVQFQTQWRDKEPQCTKELPPLSLRPPNVLRVELYEYSYI